MDVCRDVIDGLSLLKDKQRIGERDLDQIIEFLKFSWIGQQLPDPGRDQFLTGERKLLALSLSALYLSVVKCNKDVNYERDLLRSLLNSIKISEDYIEKLSNFYELELREWLIDELAKYRLSNGNEDKLHSLIDCDWKQEFMIKSKNLDHNAFVNYVINLELTGTPSGASETDQLRDLDSLKFNINLQGIQDLLLKLKECRRAIDKNFNCHS